MPYIVEGYFKTIGGDAYEDFVTAEYQKYLDK